MMGGDQKYLSKELLVETERNRKFVFILNGTVRVRIKTGSYFFNLKKSAKNLHFKGEIRMFLEFMQNQKNMNPSLS